MNQVPDRKRLRREYLRKKRDHYQDLVAATFATAAGIVLTLGFVVFTFALAASHMWGFAFLCSLIACGAAGATIWGACYIAAKTSVLTRIPYVPPITADTLPADEVLVRGSEEPPIEQSEVLLRAAKGVETPKEELLRVIQE
jgi:hypothetical protein